MKVIDIISEDNSSKLRYVSNNKNKTETEILRRCRLVPFHFQKIIDDSGIRASEFRQIRNPAYGLPNNSLSSALHIYI